MNVYLIKTPEYSLESFKEVCDLLGSYEGPLNFIPSFYEFDKNEFYFLQYELFPDHRFDYQSNEALIKYDPNRKFPLSWRELFSLCGFYREVSDINGDSFVVLLTNRKNALNWFSANDKSKNIFVNTAEWNLYTKVNAKYPIAYQVVENVMQSLMNIDLTNVPNQYVHESLRGCMNDFCRDKNQIIIKLQTANICNDCIEKIKEENVDQKILLQAGNIFEGIRNEFLFKQKIKNKVLPVPIVLTERNRILLPELDNIEIRLTPLYKTLYIFYLKHNQGVKLSELIDFKKELLELYSTLAVEDDTKLLESRIDELVNPIGGSFSQKKSKLNRIITELLEEPLSKFYRIEGEPGEPFKINIPTNLIDIRS